VQVLHPKAVQKCAEDKGMTKINARVLPVAVVVSGFIAAFGGYFTTR
jgi:hypothetical protein